ncbi:hypothetical protein BD289DRAFT_224035 [Coniella lustricola]|uniref:Uncharacterized protein n=1 Tax=Coniella lustricola TaxID=2025994 RepID=A0A2T3AAZ5_9PEZI|nr:hypothetical protein BD289DRAFT_224035 [Coniella lustricola]
MPMMTRHNVMLDLATWTSAFLGGLFCYVLTVDYSRCCCDFTAGKVSTIFIGAVIALCGSTSAVISYLSSFLYFFWKMESQGTGYGVLHGQPLVGTLRGTLAMFLAPL